MARNTFAGACRDCGGDVGPGAGYFHKQPPGSSPKWAVRCVLCVARGKQARGDSLSFAQRDALRTTPAPSVPEQGAEPCPACLGEAEGCGVCNERGIAQ